MKPILRALAALPGCVLVAGGRGRDRRPHGRADGLASTTTPSERK